MNSLGQGNMNVPALQGVAGNTMNMGLDPWGGLRDVGGGMQTGFNGGVQGNGYVPPMANIAGIEGQGGNGAGGAGGAGGIGGSGFGMNLDTASFALSGVETLGKLWMAWQGLDLAKDTLAMQKEFGNANLNNQIKSYNTALSDRSRSRGAFEGQTQAEQDKYVEDNKLSR